MNPMTRRLLLVLEAGVLLSGCATPTRRVESAADKPGALAAELRAELVWTACEEVLRQRLFELDRVDRRAGVLTTRPVMSQHFFEFWRRDVASAGDWLEATVNPVRRWVEVRVEDTVATADPGVQVSVHKERLSSPDRQFNSSGAAYQYFGDQLPSTTGLQRVGPEYDRWLPMGRDADMEAALRRDILERVGLTPS